MQSLAGTTTQAQPASKPDYETWVINLLSTYNTKHEQHRGRWVLGCDICILAAVRKQQHNIETRHSAAYLKEALTHHGFAYVNSLISTYALAMGDKDHVRPLSVEVVA